MHMRGSATSEKDLSAHCLVGNGKNVGWDVPSMESNKGGGRRYQGSVSVLKSAVQKNVRLCQPESAVRCPSPLD